MKKVKNIVLIALVAIFFINTISPLALAVDISVGDKSDLTYVRELPGLLQIKENDALRLVIRVAYENGNDKLDAFCVEPSKDGVRNRCRKFICRNYFKNSK